MQRRVRVAAPEGLHQRRRQIVHGVAPPVVAHGTALGDLLCVRHGQYQLPVLRRGRLVEQLHRVHGLAHVSAAGVGDVVRHVLLPAEGQGALRLHQRQRPVHGGTHVGGGDRLELEHRAAAEKGGIDVKVGVFRGGGDEGDGAVLHEFQQGLLLLFVEVLDLIQIQQHAAGSHQRAHVPDNALHVLKGGGGGVELVEGPVGAFGDDVGDGGLPGARGAVEDHVGVGALFDEPAQQGVPAQQMLLSDDLVQTLGPDAVR